MIRVTPLILAVAMFMEQMDSTVIATSLPAIARDIGTDPIALKLALTSYLVALAIFIPLSGWISDKYGARNVFRLAILVFLMGSIGCAFSNSLATFVVSRFVEGMGASMMTPVGRLLLVRSTPRHELVNAMAWLTIPALMGPLLGPPVGGALTTFLSWHWIFWINIPIGIAGIVLAGRFLPEVKEAEPRPVDMRGFFLAAIAFAGLVFGLSVLSLPALPLGFAYATLAVGLVSGLLYLRHAKRTTHPLLDPALLRHRLFRSTIVSGSLLRIGVGAVPFLMPLMLQIGFGLSPFQSGGITFVGALGAILSKFWAEKVFASFGFPRVLGTAAVFSAGLIALNGLFGPETPIWLIMAALLVGGLMRSLFFTGTNALAYADISDEETSQATALNAVIQQITIATGVAVAGAVLEVADSLDPGGTSLEHFHIAFFVIGTISALAVLPYLRLPAHAGSDVSGYKAPVVVHAKAQR